MVSMEEKTITWNIQVKEIDMEIYHQKLNMITSYLRDLINDHKPTAELNNEEDNSDTERGEWKIQLVMQNNCISTKDFEETHIIYSANKPLESFMGTDTDGAINKRFDTLLQRFQQAIETSNERGSGFTHESVALLHHYFQRIDIRRAESYIISPDWISKKATINPKNEKDNECFKWSIIAGLNYNKIKEKELKKLLKFRRVDTDFSSYQRDWEEFEQNNTSIALNVLFVSYNSDK